MGEVKENLSTYGKGFNDDDINGRKDWQAS
jgi:hypothetical protein